MFFVVAFMITIFTVFIPLMTDINVLLKTIIVVIVTVIFIVMLVNGKEPMLSFNSIEWGLLAKIKNLGIWFNKLVKLG